MKTEIKQIQLKHIDISLIKVLIRVIALSIFVRVKHCFTNKYIVCYESLVSLLATFSVATLLIKAIQLFILSIDRILPTKSLTNNVFKVHPCNCTLNINYFYR